MLPSHTDKLLDQEGGKLKLNLPVQKNCNHFFFIKLTNIQEHQKARNLKVAGTNSVCEFEDFDPRSKHLWTMDGYSASILMVFQKRQFFKHSNQVT